jgi:hypothetical protein
VCARRLEHADRSEHVDVGVQVRLRDGHAHVRLRGEVEARVGSDGIEDGRGVGPDVRLVQGRPVRDVFAPPAREVVEHVHLVAAREQRLDNV